MVEEHIPYKQRFGHLADFAVKYRFYSSDEGGRWSLPAQGIRLNFWYECPDHQTKASFLIYPEFEDATGNLIEGIINQGGFASMWIIDPAFRAYHQQHIQLGTVGYFKEGNRIIAVCEVIKLIGLYDNAVS